MLKQFHCNVWKEHQQKWHSKSYILDEYHYFNEYRLTVNFLETILHLFYSINVKLLRFINFLLHTSKFLEYFLH